MSEQYIEGIGRRKTSSARVRMFLGKKPSTVNGMPLEDYITNKTDIKKILAPLHTVELEGKYYFTAHVQGGGDTGQTGAIQLGLARALYKMDPELKVPLRKAGMTTRDPRMVERKKYNQKKARAKNQFSKR